jgi:hypothetical protein
MVHQQGDGGAPRVMDALQGGDGARVERGGHQRDQEGPAPAHRASTASWRAMP